MANDKKGLVKDIMENLKVGFNKDGLGKRTELAGYVLGQEDFDSLSGDTAKDNIDKLGNTIDSTLSLVLGSESFSGMDLTEAQIAAGKAIAPLALNPKAALDSLRELKSVGSKGVATIEAHDLGIEDYVTPSELATEAFDGEAISEALYFSIVANILSAKQDEFGEAFFPTIVIDPTASGIEISTEFTSLYTEVTRTLSSAPNKAKFNKQPLIKAIYDKTVFGIDKNRVVVVDRPEFATALYSGYTYVNTVSGEQITTAPILFGQVVNLLAMSQTDALIAKGFMSETDALDRTMNLDKIYYSLTTTIATVATTETFAFDTSVLAYSNFTYSTQDHEKDMILNFNTANLVVNVGTSNALTGASAVLGTLPAGTSFALSMKVVGDANTQYGDVEVSVVSSKLEAVYDSQGNLLDPASATYVAVKAITDTIVFEGYELEAYRTNSNLRTKGNTITSDTYRQIYSVPMRSGMNVVTPINNATGSNNDSKLTSQIQSIGMKVSIDAVNTVVKTAATLSAVTASGVIPNADVLGVGRYHVNTFYQEDNVVLDNVVDSLDSKSRAEDIRSALIGKIKDTVINMYVDSNYATANAAIRGGVSDKVTVLIGTDIKTKQYLTSGDGVVNIGTDFDVKVVASLNPDVLGKMFITFVVDDADKHVKPNALSFGQCLWAPTITIDVTRTTGGSTGKELFTMPRYLHVVNLPILAVLNISGYNTVIGKVVSNRRTVV